MTVHEPLVSVVIPNFNYGHFLSEAIDSVLAQSYPRVEVIVVDDGSTDESAAVLESYSGRIRSLAQRRQGVSAARNRGIAESAGDLIAFLDADDVWDVKKLEEQVPRFAEAAVGMVYCGLRYVDETGRTLGSQAEGCEGRILKEIALLQTPGVPASGSSAVIRRECFNRLGPFDINLSTGADWDMWWRIACHYEIRIVREPLASYRLHANAMHRDVDTYRDDKIRSLKKMFADPSASEVWPFRRRCYGKLYTTLSGSYLRGGRIGKCLLYAVRASFVWPPSAQYLLSFPLRRLVQAGRGTHPHPTGDVHL